MVDSPHQEGPSPRQEAQEDASPSQAGRQNLSLTGIPMPESSLGESSTPPSSGAIIQVFNDGILKAIQAGKAGKWGDLIGLVQQITCHWWWMKNRGIPTGHHISTHEGFSGFNITLDENNKDKVAEIVSNVQGRPPLLGFLQDITRTDPRNESLDFESIKKSVSILGGFGHSGPQCWETVERDHKKALHVAAEGRGPNSGHAIRALLQLMDASRSGGRIVSLDGKTTDDSKRTALHLAALNIASMEPLKQLLSAGADPWIQDSTGNTVLHLLNDNSRLKNNDRVAENNLPTGTTDSDNNRIEKIRSVLRQKVDGTKLEPHLVAINGAKMTAMGLALSTKDYEMVAVLAEASQTPSFRFRDPARDEKVWRNEGEAAFDLAVTNLDADLHPVVRSRLIRCLAKDKYVQNCVTEQDDTGRTALHKACDLAEDRDDIVEALLFNGANVHSRVGQPDPESKQKGPSRRVQPRAKEVIAEKQYYMRAGPGQEHLERMRLYAGWSALSFASRRGHRWTVLFLLANGAMEQITPAECSDIIQAAEIDGYLIVRDLIQHFRTHDSATLHRVLVHTHDEQRKGFGIPATKWPRKRTRRTEDKEKEVLKLSKYFSETEEFIPFETQSYPEQRMVYDLVKYDDGTPESWKWNTWTMKNGGWIHLPANYRKWIEDLCRAGYINERDFPQWFKIQQLQHYDKKDEISPETRELLQETYLSDSDARIIFPHIYGPLQQRSHQQSLSSQPQSSSVDSKSPPPPLAMECQKALAFIQDSLVSSQQHGSEHPRVRHGFRSLVVQRQEQRDQFDSPNVPPQLSTPINKLEARVGSKQEVQQEAPSKKEKPFLRGKYTAKSIVLPILDVDWMLPYLELPNENVPLDEILAQQARRSGVSPYTTETEVYRTRSDESDAMVSEDMDLDLDYRKDEHWKQMKELYRHSTEVQQPLSLDRYFHQDLNAREVRDRVSSQVVSRFIFYQRRLRADNDSRTNPDVAPDSLSRQRGAFNTSQLFFDSIRKAKADDDPEKSAACSPRGDSDISPEITRDSRRTGPPLQQILIVPQLWLFTIDNTVITSFPDRWDHFNVSYSLQSCFSKHVQAQSRSIKADQLLHEIFECAMQYQPSFPAFGERFTFTEAFSGEIRRISRKIEDSYDKFHKNLGNSDDVFLDAFESPTYCLRTVDDILRELAMIKRVYQDQIRVWQDFHSASSSRMGTAADNRKCRYSPTCDPKVLPERLFTRVSNLVEEAKIVQESAITLLSLLQGEASTENTISSSHQSKLLGIFTVVTVIFAPLSWIAAVFALQVQGTTWTWLRVFEGSFATAMITILLCLFGWLYLDWRNIKAWSKKVRNWAVALVKNRS